MIIKITGCIIIVFSGSLIGFTLAAKLEKRKRLLEIIKKLMDETEIYLSGEIMTTDRIIETLSLNGDYKDVINYCYYNRENCLETLSDSERQTVCDFFLRLGKSDLESQLSLVRMYRGIIEENLCSLKEVVKNKCRLLRTSGILVSLMICLLLI